MGGHIEKYNIIHAEMSVAYTISVNTKADQSSKMLKEHDSQLSSLSYQGNSLEKKYSSLQLKVDVEETKRESKLER